VTRALPLRLASPAGLQNTLNRRSLTRTPKMANPIYRTLIRFGESKCNRLYSVSFSSRTTG
jgi:hypothetical protein